MKDSEKEEKKLVQWHPAFFAGIQIEFGQEAKYLTFEPEHLLGKKPLGIDVLIKKENNRPLKKNIGRIFKKYNIIEYKGPGDYLSVDSLYKTYGYACFYKADVQKVNAIKIDDLTITLISEGYPREMIHHLREVRGYRVEEVEQGIYYVFGDNLPIQIVVTGRLSKEENRWLRSLTATLNEREEIEELIAEYKQHKNEELYKAVMDVVVRANRHEFEEVKKMCEALEELMKDELEAKKDEGKKIGGKQGENRVNALILKLSEIGRNEDIVKAAGDEEYQQKLFEEFGL